MQYNPNYIDETINLSSAEIEKFRKENLSLNLEITKALSQPEKNRLVIEDGIFDYEGYLKSKIKILWILKEPYDTNGGGWHISDSDMYKKHEFAKTWTTWYPIINISHSILSGFESWEKNESVNKTNKTTAKVLSHIAYINVQKLPSLTREKSKNSVIHTAFNNKINNDFFKRQFSLINPDIIIGGNTLNMMFEHFGLKGEFLKSKPTDNSYIVKDKLFINADHPASRSNKEVYINNIIEAVKIWRKTNL